MLVICFFFLQAMLLQADGVMLTSTLGIDGRRFACPAKTEIFTCKVEETSDLQWVADPFISASIPISFRATDDAGTSRIRGSFSANLTEVSRVNNINANLTSTLSIDVSVLGSSTVVIQCSDDTTTAASNLTVEARPDPPTNISVEDSENLEAPANVNITWNHPGNSDDFDFMIFEYNLMPTNQSNCTNDTQITLYQLPSGNYDVSVMAVTLCGTSGNATNITFSVGSPTIPTSSPIPQTPSSLSIGAIIGIVFGGILGLVLLIVVVVVISWVVYKKCCKK